MQSRLSKKYRSGVVKTYGQQTNTPRATQEHDIMAGTNSLTRQNDYVNLVLYKLMD